MQVEIWSDVVCPWCYVGKRRFERALELFPHRDDVEVVWRSFELDPSAPAERPERAVEHLAAKYGTSVAQAEAMNARLTEVAAAEGLTYHLDTLRLGNSFDAHRLIHLAAAQGLQDEMKERLLYAYFTDNVAIADHATLAALAAEVGLSASEVAEVLDGDRYADAVRADERDAAALGANGVPFFVIDRTFGVSGAQATDVFVQALETAWERSRPLTILSDDAAACTDDACAVDAS